MNTLAPSRLGGGGDVFRVGSIGLRTRKVRAALSALGIAIGIAAIVAVFGISDSSKADLLAQLDSLGTNMLTVQVGQSLGGGSATLPETAEQMIYRIPPVQQVSSVENVPAQIHRNDRIDPADTGGVQVKAARTGLLGVLRGRVAQGRFLDRVTERQPVAVLGAVAAQRLGITTLHPGMAVQIGGERFLVMGILDALPLAPDIDRSALIGYPEAQSEFGTDGTATTIYVRADPDQVDPVHNVLAGTADPEHPEEVDISQPSDALSARAAAKGAFTSLLAGVGGVALLVGGIGIANVMVISVLERRGEIGLRRALGATRRHIGVQFLTEALLLALAGGACGVILGAAATAGYARYEGWRITVPVPIMLAGVGAALLIGMIAGLYPAARAARLDPTQSLHAV